MRTLCVILTVSVMCCACGKGEEDSLAKRAGDKLGQTVTEFASGVGRGVDNQMAIEVELLDGLTQRGFAKTIAKALAPGEEKGISVYFTARDAFKGRFIAKAMNKDGQEIGRAVVDVEFKADDAQYVKFLFDKEMDMQLATRFIVDVKPTEAKQVTMLRSALEANEWPS